MSLFPFSCTRHLGVFLTCLVLAVSLTGCSRGDPRRAFYSLLLSIDLIRGPEEGDFLGKVTPAPILDRRLIQISGKTLEADFYWPQVQGVRPGLLLNHGLIDTGKDDPRLVWLARRLAQAGFVVMVPDFRGMRNFRVGIEDVEEIVNAFHYLGTLRRQVDTDRLGMMSFSYGAGPTLIAAADRRIREKVKFIVTFGGYYDLKSVVSFLITGVYPGEEAGIKRSPPASAKWLFVLHNLQLVENPEDRSFLERIARRKLRNEKAKVEDLASRLGEEGGLIYRLLTSRDPAMVSRLLDQMPPRLKRYLDDLSPKRIISRVDATLIIAHGEQDSMIPYEESVKLVNAFAERGRVTWAILKFYGHTNPRASGSPSTEDVSLYWSDFRRFYSLVYALLGQ